MDKESRIEKAQDRAQERLNYVTDCQEALDFVGVTGRMGGDMIIY